MKTTNKMYEGYSEHAISLLKKADNADYPEAKLMYDEVIRLFPEPAYAHAKRGYVLHKLGQYRQAIEDFDVAISKKPEAKNTIWQRGISKWKLSFHIEAMEDLLLYIQLEPGDPEAFYWLGEIAEEFGNLHQAKNYFESAIQLDNTHTKAANGLARVQSNLYKDEGSK